VLETCDTQTSYAVDGTGGGRNSAIRPTCANCDGSPGLSTGHSLIAHGERPQNVIHAKTSSVTSSKPFDVVVAALEAAVEHPDMVEFFKATTGARAFADLESVVDRVLGRTGLMMFMKLDHGAILRKETGLDTPKIVRFLIGNPLIMKEMAKHIPDAGSYAPVTILVDERPDGVHLSYDKMAAILAPYGNPDALNVARELDSKIEDLLRECAV
jgi:uncharacterized protein (DUF302 family)